MCNEQKFVIIETNAANSGNPETRAMVVDPEFVNDPNMVHDIVGWLKSNGINAKVLTTEEFHRKLQNYRERVAAAS